MRTKELEVQYNMARYEREKAALDAETAQVRQLNNQIQAFTKTESDLRGQLNVYVEKFKQVSDTKLFTQADGVVSPAQCSDRKQQLTRHGQVEDTLNNSNDLFLTFRREMEDMSRKTKKLEKENESLKRKHESMNQNIAKMATERAKMTKELADLKSRNEKLTSIIKAMQKQGRQIPKATPATPNGASASEDNASGQAQRNGVAGGGAATAAAAGDYDDQDDDGAEVDDDSEYEDRFEEAEAGPAGSDEQEEDEEDDGEEGDEDEEGDDDDDDDDDETEDDLPPSKGPTANNGHG